MRATQTEPERNEKQRSIVYNRTWAFFLIYSFIHLSSRVGVSTPERNSRYALRTPREGPAAPDTRRHGRGSRDGTSGIASR